MKYPTDKVPEPFHQTESKNSKQISKFLKKYLCSCNSSPNQEGANPTKDKRERYTNDEDTYGCIEGLRKILSTKKGKHGYTDKQQKKMREVAIANSKAIDLQQEYLSPREIQEKLENQEKTIKDCIISKEEANSSNYEKHQKSLNDIASYGISKDKNVLCEIHGQEKYGITKTLSIGELIAKAREMNKNGNSMFSEFHKALENALTIRYHGVGFEGSGELKKDSILSEDEDLIDDETWTAVHEVIGKAVKSYLQNALDHIQ